MTILSSYRLIRSCAPSAEALLGLVGGGCEGYDVVVRKQDGYALEHCRQSCFPCLGGGLSEIVALTEAGRRAVILIVERHSCDPVPRML